MERGGSLGPERAGAETGADWTSDRCHQRQEKELFSDKTEQPTDDGGDGPMRREQV